MLEDNLKTVPTDDPASHDDALQWLSRIEPLFLGGRLANLGGFLIGALAAVVLWPVADPGELIVWMGLFVALFLSRWILVQTFIRLDRPVSNPMPWLHMLTFMAAVSGAIWGALGWMMELHWTLGYQVFVVLVLATLAAAALMTYSLSLRVYAAFVLPMMMPNAAWLLLSGERTAVATGTVLALYSAALLYLARSSGDNLHAAVDARLRNSKLLGDLAAARNELREQAESARLAADGLLASERKYRSLVEGSLQGMLIHRDWRPLFANQAFADLLGFESIDEVLALPSLAHLFSSYQLKRVHTHGRPAVSDDMLVKYEAEAARQDGSRIILQCVVRSVIWDDEPAIQISVIDISDLARTTRALEAIEESYQKIFSTITDAAILFDATTLAITDANNAALALYGYDWDEILTLKIDDLTAGESPLASGDDNDENEPSRAIADHHRHRSGYTFPVEISMSNIDLADTSTVCAIVRDVTDRHQAEQAIRESEGRFRDFAETAADFFWETNAEHRFSYVSERYAEVSGLTPEQLLGLEPDPLTVGSVADNRRWREHQEKIANHQPFTDLEVSCVRRDDGHILILRNSATPKFDDEGNFKGYRGVVRNVTEAYNLSRQLSYQASHDALTGLVNRAEFEQCVLESIENLRKSPSGHALCYLDLDQFKLINDTCGHAAGDELLRQLSVMLQSRVRRTDTLARLGGDEFAILMENCTIEKAQEVADGIRRAIEEFQFLWERNKFTVGVSIGLVPISNAGERLEDLLRAADSACYAAKDMGRNRVHVYHAADEELARREGEMQWVSRINQALEDDLFELHYQSIEPLGDTHGGTHYELLLRMRDQNGLAIPPGAYLPAAERYNLMGKVDRWVVTSAIDWLESNPRQLDALNLCSINLSGMNLGDEEFLALLIDRLNNTRVPGEKLCFEVTETAAIQNLAAAARFITELRKRGCLFALDDFGSGLSSFAYLKNLPVDYLKIDGVFVRDILHDPIDFAMVKSINEIGKVMGKKTIAEFVESGAVAARLQSIGVDFVQGHHFSKPRPLDELLSDNDRN